MSNSSCCTGFGLVEYGYLVLRGLECDSRGCHREAYWDYYKVAFPKPQPVCLHSRLTPSSGGPGFGVLGFGLCFGIWSSNRDLVRM